MTFVSDSVVVSVDVLSWCLVFLHVLGFFTLISRFLELCGNLFRFVLEVGFSKDLYHFSHFSTL